jgi:hypothetical protein
MYPRCGYTLLCSIQPLPLLFISPLLPTPHFSTAFSIYPYILYLHMLCDITDAPSLSFLFPEFHRAVPLLQTCSTYGFVYDYACFCVLVYILDLSSTCERKHVAFVFLNLAFFFTQHDVLQVYPFTFKLHVVIVSYGLVTLHCVYIPQFLDLLFSCRAPGLFPKLGYCE